jgi:catalase
MKGQVMRTLFKTKYVPGTAIAILAAGVLLAGHTSGARGQDSEGKPLSEKELVHAIFDTMRQVHGVKPGYRVVHAKGIICKGTFVPSKDAGTLSRAGHFQHDSVDVTVRLSDGNSDPIIPDNAPNAGPRGMVIRFKLPNGDETDIIALSVNGFAVSTGEDFLALQKAVVATDPTKPHPWPIEGFLGAHPNALRFVKGAQVVPASFATESFFPNNTFIFVNKAGVKQPGRYEIIPLPGQHDLSDAEAKAKPEGFLFEDLKTRLAAGPIQYHLMVRLPNAGDSTKDPSLIWPEDRKTMDMGVISITSLVPDSTAVEKALAFDPTNLTDGIELSDDPFPSLRSKVYALASANRQ